MFQLFLSQKLMSHILKCHYFAEIGKSLKKLLFKSFFLINSRVLGNKMLRFLFKMQILFVKNLSKGENLWEMYLEKRFSCLKEAVFRNCGLKYEYIYIYIYIYILSGFSFTDTNDSQDSAGREGTFFYSMLPLPPAHEHLFATLHVTWLSRIFNRTVCIYQTAIRWDLLPYRITIWLIDDVTLVFFVCLRDDLILAFLLQQFETWKRWTRTLIDYHPCITSGPTNQVC